MSYTLVLGTKDWSSWSLRPYMAMRATGAPFEEIVLRLRQPDSREQILRHSPAGKVPVLKITEGGRTHVVWDSLAVCETLAERTPRRSSGPTIPMCGPRRVPMRRRCIRDFQICASSFRWISCAALRRPN
ncbi:MAG TPA: glutathione S-transferase N-terminal domain-containing protein [Rhizomicrobium sp.]|nr:glutathione S-transferase N-terminal domain-containing protein [Rhizomicrobium sp.]